MKAGTSYELEGEGLSLLLRHASVAGRLLFVVGLVAVLSGCCRTAEVTGKWQCGLIVISIYDDGVASFSGAKATWSTISSEAVRLEFEDKGEAAVAELRVKDKGDNDLRAATFHVGGIQTDCSELPSEEGS
jgi:hypothetical protein